MSLDGMAVVRTPCFYDPLPLLLKISPFPLHSFCRPCIFHPYLKCLFGNSVTMPSFHGAFFQSHPPPKLSSISLACDPVQPFYPFLTEYAWLFCSLSLSSFRQLLVSPVSSPCLSPFRPFIAFGPIRRLTLVAASTTVPVSLFPFDHSVPRKVITR